jgi:hypothetical protein
VSLLEGMEKSIFGNEQGEIQIFVKSLEKMNTISALFKTAKTVEDLNAINLKLTQIMRSVQTQNKDPLIYTPVK